MMLWLLSSAWALDPHLQTLLSDSGWEVAGRGEEALLGTVEIAVKEVAGVRCMRGEAAVPADAAAMQGVVADIRGALSWSRAGLVDTRLLGERGPEVDYLQVLDVPDWTGAADRYWVLRGQGLTVAQGERLFVWDRFDWRAAYPALAEELKATRPKAVEPDPNFGAWAFLPQGTTSRVRYYLCTESGSLPGWLQRAAATRTVPAAMADVVREARRRAP